MPNHRSVNYPLSLSQLSSVWQQGKVWNRSLELLDCIHRKQDLVFLNSKQHRLESFIIHFPSPVTTVITLKAVQPDVICQVAYQATQG